MINFVVRSVKGSSRFIKERPLSEMYANMVDSICGAAREALGIVGERNRANEKEWWSEEIGNLVSKKRNLRLAWLGSKEDEVKQECREAKNLVRNTVEAEKNKLWDDKCAEVESYVGGQKCSVAWRFIRATKENHRDRVPLSLIKPEEWVQHYKELLTENRPEYLHLQGEGNLGIGGKEILVNEKRVSKAVRRLRNGKSSGPEGIYSELIKYGTPKLVSIIPKMFNQCLKGHPIPEMWKLAYISSVHKRGNRKDPKNYRGISVTNTLSRLYGRILKELIEEEVSDSEEEEQSGFRAGRSCTDNVFCLKHLIEKKTAKDQEIHITFIDLQKAYDTVPIVKLWEVLEESGMNRTLIQAVKNIYDGSRSKVNIGNSVTESFPVTKDLRQG